MISNNNLGSLEVIKSNFLSGNHCMTFLLVQSQTANLCNEYFQIYTYKDIHLINCIP